MHHEILNVFYLGSTLIFLHQPGTPGVPTLIGSCSSDDDDNSPADVYLRLITTTLTASGQTCVQRNFDASPDDIEEDECLPADLYLQELQEAAQHAGNASPITSLPERTLAA